MLGSNPDDSQKDRETGKPKLVDWEWVLLPYRAHNVPPNGRVEHSRDYGVIGGERGWICPELVAMNELYFIDLQRTYGNDDSHMSS